MLGTYTQSLSDSNRSCGRTLQVWSNYMLHEGGPIQLVFLVKQLLLSGVQLLKGSHQT